MAERLDEWPEEFSRYTARYPWTEWMDGKVWKITHGEDFQCEIENMRQNIYSKAFSNGMKARTTTRLADGVIVFQFITEDTISAALQRVRSQNGVINAFQVALIAAQFNVMPADVQAVMDKEAT